MQFTYCAARCLTSKRLLLKKGEGGGGGGGSGVCSSSFIIMQSERQGARVIRDSGSSARIARSPLLQLRPEVTGDLPLWLSVCRAPAADVLGQASPHRGEAGPTRRTPWRWKRTGTSCGCRTCWRNLATKCALIAATQVGRSPLPHLPEAGGGWACGGCTVGEEKGRWDS